MPYKPTPIVTYEMFVAAVRTHGSVAQAAPALGISLRTAWRYLKTFGFKKVDDVLKSNDVSRG